MFLWLGKTGTLVDVQRDTTLKAFGNATVRIIIISIQLWLLRSSLLQPTAKAADGPHFLPHTACEHHKDDSIDCSLARVTNALNKKRTMEIENATVELP